MCLFQSNEVGNSQRMEKEGFERSLNFLESQGLNIGAIVTDRHPSIGKFMKERRPSIRHLYTWHVAKGIFIVPDIIPCDNTLQDWKTDIQRWNILSFLCLSIRSAEEDRWPEQGKGLRGCAALEEECHKSPVLVWLFLKDSPRGRGKVDINSQPHPQHTPSWECALSCLSTPTPWERMAAAT